jgi:transcriptional regulator NrdR family protein
MHCSNCGEPIRRGTTRILQARNDTIESKLRNRICKHCNYRFWTVEVELPPKTVKWVRCDDPDTNVYSVPTRMEGARRITIQ